jgi:gluconokinase
MCAGKKQRNLWIGVDVGTTGVRAVAYYANGQSAGAESALYSLYTPKPSWVEQKPAEIYAATELVVCRLADTLVRAGENIRGLVLSTVMHSFIALDEKHQAISEMMTWADSRSAVYAEELKKNKELSDGFYQKTCCPAHATYPLYKIVWLQHHCPDVFAQMKYVGSIKDYIFAKLTTEWVLDRSTASASGIYNSTELKWDKDILKYLHINETAMPPVVSTTYCQTISKEAAKRLHLPLQVRVVIGATDGVLVNLGIGAVQEGQLSATIGTSGAIRMLTKQPKIDPKGRTWCYNLTDDLWVTGGAINNGGIAQRWLRDEIFDYTEEKMRDLAVDAYDLMSLQASKIPAGADGLILLPFFTGERAPYWNSNVRAAFVGLTLNHKRAHLIRATLEGVCYSLNSVLKALRDFGKVRDVRVSGSFTKSSLWMQIMADVFNEKITVANIAEGAAFGAAVLGFIVDGDIPNVGAAAKLVGVKKIYVPDEKNVVTYQQLYRIYEKLYDGMKEPLKEIVDYQNKV